MQELESQSPPPRAEPMFKLEFGDNGGRLAPTSASDLMKWVQVEQQTWQWALQNGYGSHEQGFRQALSSLGQAHHHAQQAQQYGSSNPNQAQYEIDASRRLLEECFLRRRLPHSSTSIAKRILAFQESAGKQAGSYMLATYVPPDQGNYFQPNDLQAWRGLVEALIDRFQLAAEVPKAKKLAAEISFKDLQGKVQSLFDDKTTQFDDLHRRYVELVEGLSSKSSSQADTFASSQTERADAFGNLLAEHKSGMEALRKAFREEIALRAPAEYWRSKQSGHRWMAGITGLISFGGIGGAAVGIGWMLHELLLGTLPGQQPELWRLGLLAIIAVFATWAVRLVVRMFLSHVHLAGDAAERVVMVQTYLSLLEGDRLSSKEDRQLILQALFRPASDGIVKDDAAPASFMELVTRNPKP
jgi:Family of unknown function (DUF6161)